MLDEIVSNCINVLFVVTYMRHLLMLALENLSNNTFNRLNYTTAVFLSSNYVAGFYDQLYR